MPAASATVAAARVGNVAAASVGVRASSESSAVAAAEFGGDASLDDVAVVAAFASGGDTFAEGKGEAVLRAGWKGTPGCEVQTACD